MLIVGGVDIGNRKDVSPRMIDAIRSSDIILAENIRLFLDLCNTLNIEVEAEIIHYYAPMDEEKDLKIVSEIDTALALDKTVLVVSDDGMPGIADPGGRIIRMAHERGHRVTVVPGPSIVSTLPAVLGVYGGSFTFEDELPDIYEQRLEKLNRLKNENRGFLFIVKNRRDDNVVFKETLKDIVSVFPSYCEVGIGLNITMPNEKIILGNVSTIMNQVKEYEFSPKDFIAVYVGASYE